MCTMIVHVSVIDFLFQYEIYYIFKKARCNYINCEYIENDCNHYPSSGLFYS